MFYDDLGDVVHQLGLTAVSERIDALIKQHRPGIIVIDSFKALRTFAASDADFRRFLHDLAGRLTAIAVSSLWVGEYEPDEATNSPEFAVADAVIGVETKRTLERSIRYLSVRKLRGSAFLSGDHVYRITSDGLVVFPRLADQRDTAVSTSASERLSTGIAALDDALEEGYWSGSTTLIAGPSGAGKTLMGLHFVYAGAARDENSVFVTLQESRGQLARVISRFGWTIDDPHVTIMDRSPVDMYIDELIYDVLDRMHAVGARRLVIDSLNDLIVAAPDPMRLREFLYSLVQRCEQQNINAMFTYETMELFRTTRLSELGMSHIADNVILLQHVQDGAADETRPQRPESQRLQELLGDQRVPHLVRGHHTGRPARRAFAVELSPFASSSRATPIPKGGHRLTACRAQRARPADRATRRANRSSSPEHDAGEPRRAARSSRRCARPASARHRSARSASARDARPAAVRARRASRQ